MEQHSVWRQQQQQHRAAQQQQQQHQPAQMSQDDELASFLSFGEFPLDLFPDGQPPDNVDPALGITSSDLNASIQQQLGVRQGADMPPSSQSYWQPVTNGGQYHSFIPPTPNSIELQAGQAAQLFQQMDPRAQAVFLERYQRMKDDAMVFTPLVSPAVTPLDTNFPISEYSSIGSYFSPLTSPALEAQNRNSVYRADGSAGPSPIDGIDPMLAKRKSRRKNSTSRARVVMQSPMMKAQRKKGLTRSTDFANALDTTNSASPGLGKHESSEAESISPEPLSEALMAPPPPPTGRSPIVLPQNGLAPATPASLMRMSSQPQPDPTVVSPIDPQSTPKVGSGTPQMQPLPRPIVTATSSSETIKSPTDKKAPNGNQRSKKRNNSSHVSPALQPKISPSIKPLLPEGGKFAHEYTALTTGISSQTSALLLASKSNYQNLIEGNHSQLGLSYPEHLSTNLTSKRTSHKIAEQGRRNRINNALQEIAALLPREGGESDNLNAEKMGSKASTVELAITYIKSLQQELATTKAKLAEAEASNGDAMDKDE